MQGIIEDVVRWVGCAVLPVITLGRDRGGAQADRLPDGAVGLAVIIGLTYAAWTR